MLCRDSIVKSTAPVYTSASDVSMQYGALRVQAYNSLHYSSGNIMEEE